MSDREEIIKALCSLGHEIEDGRVTFFGRIGELADAVMAARSTPKQGEAEGWQPIETAQKVGNVLLWASRAPQHAFIGQWGDYDRINHPRITHWMKLPEAPHAR